MGKGIDHRDFEDCLKRQKLVKFAPAKKLTTREIESAKEDLENARDSLKQGKDKWATIQAYYAMFHTARGAFIFRGLPREGPLLFNRGDEGDLCRKRRAGHTAGRGLSDGKDSAGECRL